MPTITKPIELDFAENKIHAKNAKKKNAMPAKKIDSKIII